MALLPTLLALTAVQAAPTAVAPLLWRGAPLPISPDLDDAETRWRPVSLEGSEWLGHASIATTRIELFDGHALEVELRRIATPRPGSAVWRGDLGEPGSGDHLLLAWVDGSAAATVWLDGELFRLRESASGLLLTEVNGADLPSCACGAEHEVSSSSSPSGDRGPALETYSGSVETVDVLTAYTPAVRQSLGGTNGALALVDLAVAETNLSYSNCDAGIFLRLVHAYETNYSESSSISTDLSRWRSTNDGYMDEVHALRDTWGADACALISNSSGACGVAYLMTNVSQNFQSSAFSVTVRTCATGYYTYGHELGHNFGCAHDTDNAGSSSKSYGYGYRTPNNLYRTVMAYSPGSRKPIFSSPLHTWNGYVMGTAQKEDNARALTENAPTIANWRPATVGGADCNGNGLSDQYEIANGLGSDFDLDGALDQCGDLYADVQTVSLVMGGTQTLTLDAGAAHAGEFYLLLGSLGGVGPTPLLGVDLPLTADAYFDLTLGQGGAGLLGGNFGVLDAGGRATATFSIPPTPNFLLVLTPARHAYLTFDANLSPLYVSKPFPAWFAFF
jgi:hypothetical protein